MTDRLPPLGPDGSNHSSVLELSALLDRALSVREAAAINAHVEACLGCADQLNRLRLASLAISSAGRPRSPAGAADAAVVAAMASTALNADQQARLADPGESMAGLAMGPASFIPRVASSSARSGDRVPADPALRSSAATDATDRAKSEPARGRSSNTTWRPPWMPDSLDSESAKGRAISRHRRTRLVLRVAAVALLCVIGGGIYLATRHSPSHPVASGGTGQTTLGTAKARTSTSLPHGGPVVALSVPPRGVFALQLRALIGPGDCTKYARRVESINGQTVFINPPGATRAVVAVPAAAGQTESCITVGPSFGAAWRGDVTGVRVAPGRTSGSATVTFVLLRDGVSSPLRLLSVLSKHSPIEALGQGADVGATGLSPAKTGYRLSMRVSRAVAVFLANQLKR